jgi:ferredoxin--NADP+ reductase
VKFSPLELREALHVEGVQSIVYDEDFQYDEGSQAAIDSNNQVRVMVKTLEDLRENPQAHEERRLHLHFFSAPVEVLGEDGKVVGLKVQRTKLDGTGNVTPIDEFQTFPIQAVYRAVGYFGSAVDEIPFDSKHGVIRNSEGRVLAESGEQIPGVYCTGWIKRGPVGLIGHTKADAIETISHVIADKAMWWQPTRAAEAQILETLDSRGVKYLDWKDWLTLDAKELSLGAQDGRERKKLFDREEIASIIEGAK